MDAPPDGVPPDGRLIRPGLDLGSIPFFHQPLELSPKQTPLGGEPIVLKEQGAPRQATTPIAKAAAQTAQAIVPAAPKADKVEIAALELLLAEPQNQAMVREFGGKLEPLPTWTTVGQGIEARYGQDLGSRLYQLQNAQRAVEGKFFTAMDQALQNPPPAPPPFSTLNQLRGQSEPVSAQPGWTYEPGSRHWDGAGPSWRFDPGAFSRAWAAGDSAAQKAFAHLHGPDALKYVPEPNAEGGASAHWELADRPVVLGRALDREEGLTPDAVAGAQAGSHNSAQSPGWAPSRVQRADTELDPSRITKLIDKEFVWFDPQRGFCTDADNLKQSGIDKAFPYIFAAAMTAMSFGAGSTLAATVSSAAGGGTTGAMAVGATGAFISNASFQLAANGKINFGQLLRSTLAGGATAGLLDVTGLNSVPEGTTLGQRLMNYTGRATLQGAIQSIMGGKFRDGFVNSMMGSVAAEVSQQLNSHIAQLEGNGSLSASEASAMRLLSRATGSALRIAGSADPAAGFASDFLGGLMHDGLAAHQPNTDAAGSAPPADPLGDFIAGNDERRARLAEIDRQIEWELQADEARAASLPDDDMFIDAGGPARGGVRNPQPVVMVRNGNWDSALNVASDPLGLLAEMQGLQADLGRLDRINAENHLNSMRERMREAGMTDVPTGNRQAWVAGGNIVTDYASTLSDLQTRYEDFRRDLRLRESWGDDYRNIRVGRNQMTVVEFESTMLNAQQRAVDAAFDRGRELIAQGKLPVERGYAQTLGVFIDDQVREVLRGTANAIGVNESQDSTRLAVNRRISNMVDDLYGLPDLRLGANIYADTTLARKDPTTRQIRTWDYINRGHYLILRPSSWGGSYALPRDQVTPYNPNRRR